MNLPTLINYIGDIADAVGAAVPKIVATCSMLAAFLPAPEDGGVLSRLHKAINLLAFNFNHARKA